MKRQPDFTQIFHDYFGSIPQKVTYTVRWGGNRFHDLVFLNSIIHDARFKVKNIKQKGKQLTIPINRDCWEIPSVHREKPKPHIELYVADSQLAIFPVLRIDWSYQHGIDFTDKTELWIQEIWLDRQSDDETCNLTIYGFDWKCVLQVDSDGLKIKLQDFEKPYLYSERHKKANQSAPPDRR
jgi:hypothetical protein